MFTSPSLCQHSILNWSDPIHLWEATCNVSTQDLGAELGAGVWGHPSAISKRLQVRDRPQSARLGLPQPGQAAGVSNCLDLAQTLPKLLTQWKREQAPGSGQSEMLEGWDLSTQSSPQAAYKVEIVLRVGTHLQQQPVDLFCELLDAGVQGLLLFCAWLSKHVLIQRAPA